MKIVIIAKALSIGTMHDARAIIKILRDFSFPKIRTICDTSQFVGSKA